MIRFEDIKPPRRRPAAPPSSPATGQAGKKLARAKKALARAIPKPKGKPTMTDAATTPKPKRAPSGALAKPVTPDAALAAIVGADPLPRTAIVSKLWEYIKANDCQNPANKREILAHGLLEPIFGQPSLTMFELNKVISNHVTSA